MIRTPIEIQLWALDKLKPYENNARTHSDEQIEQIVASINEFGFTNPILVDSSDGIIAGHGRLIAAKKIGLKRVPVIILDYLTEQQRRAYIIADNKLALNAGWDLALLSKEIERLSEEGFELPLLGFSDEELDELLNIEDLDESEDETEEDEIPEPAETPKVQRGEVYHLGKHRLICGDSTDVGDVEKLMGNARADMAFCSLVFTDPPWNVNYGDKGREILGDNQKSDEWETFLNDAAASLFMVTCPGAPIYVVMGSQEWPSVDAKLREVGFHWSSTLVWVKDQFVLTRKDYHSQFEPIWYGWNSEAARLRPLDDRTQSDVWHFPRPRVSELHPMMKPVELIEKAIVNSSKKGDVVVDLFGGSGSTLIACEKTGRAARVCEMDPRYAGVILDRWQNLTGKKAKRSDGISWDAIKEN